jgi:hypothetical protein
MGLQNCKEFSLDDFLNKNKTVWAAIEKLSFRELMLLHHHFKVKFKEEYKDESEIITSMNEVAQEKFPLDEVAEIYSALISLLNILSEK